MKRSAFVRTVNQAGEAAAVYDKPAPSPLAPFATLVERSSLDRGVSRRERLPDAVECKVEICLPCLLVLVQLGVHQQRRAIPRAELDAAPALVERMGLVRVDAGARLVQDDLVGVPPETFLVLLDVGLGEREVHADAVDAVAA